jgi:AraC-like DNA-binding protein
MGYLANFIFGLVSYITAPVLFTALIYVLSYIGLKRVEIIMPKARYGKSPYNDQQIDKCFQAWEAIVETNSIYKDPAINLPKAAELLNVTTNLLSETINRRVKLTFPDYINSLRIRDAMLMLKDPAFNNLKIAAIAYETGFSSISVFNAAFKKHANITPSSYRKQVSGRVD